MRAVGVTGAGRAFSSGADLRDLTTRGRTEEGEIDVYTTLTTVYHPILTTLRRMPKPVVAAINGPAAGIGCSLALACDLLVCAEPAYMLLAFVNIGLVPDGGALAFVSARAGAGRATQMAMLGERIGAATLLEWGLVDEVVPGDELTERVGARLDALAAGPTGSYAGIKRQLNAWLYSRLDEQLELEARVQQERVTSADFREGVTAFLEKRAAELRRRMTPVQPGYSRADHGSAADRRRMNTMRAALAPAHIRSRRRLFALTLLAALTGILTLAGVASADFWTPESGGSPQADSIDNLYKIILAVAAVVFFGVEGVLLYSVIKFRARKDAVPAQIRGNTRLEIGWTLGAAVILVILAVVTFGMLDDIRNPPNSDADGFPTREIENVQNASAYQPRPPSGKALNIEVNGQRYAWRYTYPDGDTNTLNNVFDYETMYVPTKTTVTLTIKAQDVAHSWWIPQLGGKFDAVPGHLNFTWFKVHKPGVYKGQCAELCGRNHADMVAKVVAVTPDEFKAWLERKRTEIDEADKAAQTRRAEENKQTDAGASPVNEEQAPEDETP